MDHKVGRELVLQATLLDKMVDMLVESEYEQFKNGFNTMNTRAYLCCCLEQQQTSRRLEYKSKKKTHQQCGIYVGVEHTFNLR